MQVPDLLFVGKCLNEMNGTH